MPQNPWDQFPVYGQQQGNIWDQFPEYKPPPPPPQPNFLSRIGEGISGLGEFGLNLLGAPFSQQRQAALFESFAAPVQEATKPITPEDFTEFSRLGGYTLPTRRLTDVATMLRGGNPQALREDFGNENWGAVAGDLLLPALMGPELPGLLSKGKARRGALVPPERQLPPGPSDIPYGPEPPPAPPPIRPSMGSAVDPFFGYTEPTPPPPPRPINPRRANQARGIGPTFESPTAAEARRLGLNPNEYPLLEDLQRAINLEKSRQAVVQPEILPREILPKRPTLTKEPVPNIGVRNIIRDLMEQEQSARDLDMLGWNYYKVVDPQEWTRRAQSGEGFALPESVSPEQARMIVEGSYRNLERTPDPNFNQGMGNPELAGFTPYPIQAEVNPLEGRINELWDRFKGLVEQPEVKSNLTEQGLTQPDQQLAWDYFRATEPDAYIRYVERTNQIPQLPSDVTPEQARAVVDRWKNQRQDLDTFKQQNPEFDITGEPGPNKLDLPPALPKELGGAKPRYGYREDNFSLEFDNDIDRASYIVGTNQLSRRAKDYLRWVHEQTGWTDTQIAEHGRKIRETIKPEAAKAYKDPENKGVIRVPRVYTPPFNKDDIISEAGIGPVSEMANPQDPTLMEKLRRAIAEKRQTSSTEVPPTEMRMATPQEMEIPEAESAFGNRPVRMELGSREAVIQAFKSVYKGERAQVAGKEIIQNAIDAAATKGDAGQVDIDINPKDGVVTVTDNGPGLNAEAIEGVFLTLAESGKRGTEGFHIGEMGLGKTTYLTTGNKVEISTVAREKDGNLVRYEFGGTPAEVLEGFNVGGRRVKQFRVPEGTPTGVTIRYHADPKEKGFQSLTRYIKRLAQYSKVPVNLTARAQNEYSSVIPPETFKMQPSTMTDPSLGTEIGKAENPYAKIRVIQPPDANRIENNAISIIITARGMFQGVESITYPNKMMLPDRLIVDVDPKVDAQHDNYPMIAPTRERLHWQTEDLVRDIVQKQIIEGEEARIKEELARIFQQLKPQPGQPFAIVDRLGVYTPEEIAMIRDDIHLQKTLGILQRALPELTELFKDRMIGPVTGFGWVLDNTTRGINVKDPKTGEMAILFNPQAILRSAANASEAADAFVHILLHEFTHTMVREEGKDFTAVLANVNTKFGTRRQLPYANALESTLNAGGGQYPPKIRELLQRTDAIQGREPRSENALIEQEGSNINSGFGGKGKIPPDNGRGGKKPEPLAGGGGFGGNKPPGGPSWPSGMMKEPEFPPPNWRTSPKTGKPMDPISEAWMFAKAWKTILDVSYLLRQGKGMMIWPEFWKNIKAGFDSFGSDVASQVLRKKVSEGKYWEMIKNHPTFRTLGKGLHGEEAIPSVWVEEGLPIAEHSILNRAYRATIGNAAKRSNRAYTDFLLKTRSDILTSVLDDMKSVGIDPAKNPYYVKLAADAIGNISGRGNAANLFSLVTGKGRYGQYVNKNVIRAWEQNVNKLNYVMFSPRNVMSQVQVLNPYNYVRQPKHVRQIYMKSMLGRVMYWGTVAVLSKTFLDAEIENDPASADFAKIKIGDVRLEPSGGITPWLVAATRVAPDFLSGGRWVSTLTGKEHQLSTDYNKDRWDVLSDFGANKAHPILNFLYHGFFKNNRDPKIMDLALPMAFEDTIEIIKSDPGVAPFLEWPVKAGLEGLMLSGESIQSYKPFPSQAVPRNRPRGPRRIR